MNVNEYIKINFDNNTATTSSSVNTSFNSSFSTSRVWLNDT